MSGPSQERALVEVAERARRAEIGSRPGARQDATRGIIRRAIVQTINEDGSYNVGVLGADASTVDSIDGVRLMGTGELNVGQIVTLSYEGLRPVPWIIGGAGGGAESTSTVITGYIRFFS